MCEWNGSKDKVCEQHAGRIRPGIRQEIWSNIRPYLVEYLVHFIILCLAMISIFLALSLCEKLFHEPPIIIKIILNLSEIGILLQFIKLTLVKSYQLLMAMFNWR